MHTIVPTLQGIISVAITTTRTAGFNVTPNPPLVGQELEDNHYAYMNYLWKHLTETSINLRSKFKSIVKDLKRIVGSKNFTANSLMGAYSFALLLDELKESNNTTLTSEEIETLKNSDEITKCRRGLLPLLVPEHPANSILFATMVVDLLNEDYALRDHDVETYSTNNILLFLGFLFSIKIKSNASIGPRNMLSLIDSIDNFHHIPNRDSLLPYRPDNTAVCSLSSLPSSNLDAVACAVGGVAYAGGAHSKATTKPSPAAPKTSTKGATASAAPKTSAKGATASAAPKTSAKGATASAAPKTSAKGVSKLSTKGQKKTLLDTIKEIESGTAKVTKPSATKVKDDTQIHASLKVSKKTIMDQKAEDVIRKKKAEDVIRKKKAAALHELLNPSSGPFKKFMSKIHEVTFARGIVTIPKTCVSGITRQEVYNIARKYNDILGTGVSVNPYHSMHNQIGGGYNNNNSHKKNNKTKSTNKISKTNNHTRRNKNKHKKNAKTKYNTKYKKVIPSSYPESRSNRKKHKSNLSRKNVTFKRRRYNK